MRKALQTALDVLGRRRRRHRHLLARHPADALGPGAAPAHAGRRGRNRAPAVRGAARVRRPGRAADLGRDAARRSRVGRRARPAAKGRRPAERRPALVKLRASSIWRISCHFTGCAAPCWRWRPPRRCCWPPAARAPSSRSCSPRASSPSATASADLGQGGSRYTVNDGSVNIWTQHVAASFGVPLAPAAAGGTSYATGNARVNAKPDAAGSSATPTVTEQIDSFLAGRRASAPTT